MTDLFEEPKAPTVKKGVTKNKNSLKDLLMNKKSSINAPVFDANRDFYMTNNISSQINMNIYPSINPMDS